jgi:hypothetical protein
MSYQEPYQHGTDVTMYDYYGLFLTDIAARNHERGMYGITGQMVEDELAKYGGRIDNDDLVFENDAHASMFILRWSR